MSEINDLNSLGPIKKRGRSLGVVCLTNAWGFSLLLAPGIAWYGLNNGIGIAMMYLGVLGLELIPIFIAFFSLLGVVLAWPLSKLSVAKFEKLHSKSWKILFISLFLAALCSFVRGAMGLTD